MDATIGRSIARSTVAVLSLFIAAASGRAQDYQLDDTAQPLADAVLEYSDLGDFGQPPVMGQPPAMAGRGCDGCGPGGCAACLGCPPVCNDGRIWFQSNYLLWWTKGNRLPALVTTSPEGTDRAVAGVLGVPGTTVLYGDERVDTGARSGLRYRLGMWLDPFLTTGIEGHYFYLGEGDGSDDFSTFSLGDPILARPFFNVQLGRQDAQLIAFPGIVRGEIDIRTSSEMHSAGALVRQAWRRGPCHQVDLLAGYRYFRFREGLSIYENLVVLDAVGFPEGTRIELRDNFATENDFHGGEIGMHGTFRHGRLVLDVVGKLAIGNVHQQVRVNGNTSRILPNGRAAVSEGGLLALPSNIGERSRNEFAFLPELNLNLRYPLLHNVDLTVGYTLLYLTRVVRTGDQIDTGIDPSQLIGIGRLLEAERPEARLRDTAIWAQGLNVGLHWSY